MDLRWIQIQLILIIIFFSQINRIECLTLSRKFLRGMALGVLFGRNMFGKHLGGGHSAMPMPSVASSCPMPKPKCSSKDKHEDKHYEKHDAPVQSTFPVYIHSPQYFFKYPPPLYLDDHSLNEFLHENRRLLRILRS